MEVSFSKYHGAGNDFIFIDNRDARYKLSRSQRERMCHRHFGIGSDGILEIRSSEVADFKLMYFNSDGKEGSLCGNGSRCAIAFAFKIGIRKRNERPVLNSEARFDIKNQSNNERSKIGRKVQVDVGGKKVGDQFNNGKIVEKVKPFCKQDDVEFFRFEAYDGLHIGGVSDEIVAGSGYHSNFFYVDIKDVELENVKVYDSGDIFMNTGSPHHVAFLDCHIEAVDVVKRGREIMHELYGSEGSNINFVSSCGRVSGCGENVTQGYENETKVENHQDERVEKNLCQNDQDENKNDKCNNDNLDNNFMFVRTFERGVYDETLACGTGCVAVAIADYVREMRKTGTLNVDNKDGDVKGDVTASSDAILVTKFNYKSDNSGGTSSKVSSNKPSKEKRIMKALGGCIIVTFTVNEKEDDVSGRAITFTDIKLAGPVELVFDGAYEV